MYNKTEFKKLTESAKNKRILLYGAGQFAKDFIKNNDLSSLNILGIIDSNPDKIGYSLYDYKIFHIDDIENIKELRPDLIVLTVLNENDVLNSPDFIKLKSVLNCEVFTGLASGIISPYQFRENFRKDQTNKKPQFQKYEIGDYTYDNGLSIFYDEGLNTVKIGNFCSIAGGVQILLCADHHDEWITTFTLGTRLEGFEYNSTKQDMKHKGDIIIQNDVWIGRNAVILSGCTIGNGAIIGANSVVTKDVPPYAIVAGNPAKIIRYRFSEEVIKDLLEIAWWNRPISKIKENQHLLESDNLEEFIKLHKKAAKSE